MTSQHPTPSAMSRSSLFPSKTEEIVLPLPCEGEWKAAPSREAGALTLDAVWPPRGGVPVRSPVAGRVSGIAALPLSLSGGEAGMAALSIEIAPRLYLRAGPFRRRDVVVRSGQAVRPGALLGHLRSLPRTRLVLRLEREEGGKGRERRRVAVPFSLGRYRTHPRIDDPAWRYRAKGFPAAGELLAPCGRTPWMEDGLRPRFPSHAPLYSLHTSEGAWREAIDVSGRDGADFVWRSLRDASHLRFRLVDGLCTPLSYSPRAEAGGEGMLGFLWHAGAFPLHPLQGMTWEAPRPLLPGTGEAGLESLARLMPVSVLRRLVDPRERFRPTGEIVYADAASGTFKVRRSLPERPDFLLELTFSATHGLVEGLLKTERSWRHVHRIR